MALPAHAAEAADGGKANGAVFEGGFNRPGYEVETVSPDGSTRSVFVAARSGQVTTAVADTADTEIALEDEQGEHGEVDAD